MLPTDAVRSAATSYVVPPANRRRRPLRRRHPVPGVVTTTGCLLAYLHVRLHAPDRFGHETADEVAEHILRMMGMSPAEAHEVSHRPLPWTRPWDRHSSAPDWVFRGFEAPAAHLPSGL